MPTNPVEPLVNLTACEGSQTGFVVPTDQVADDLPPHYQMDGLAPGTTTMGLDLLVCGKVAVNGVDAGPVTFARLILNIKDPPANESGLSFYLFETYTDNPMFSSWLSNLGIPTKNGTVHYSFSSPAGPWGESKAEVVDANGVVYSVTGYPTAGKSAREYAYQIYFDELPSRGFLKTAELYMGSDGGPGSLQMSPSSRLAEILEGQPVEAALVTGVDETNWKMTYGVP